MVDCTFEVGHPSQAQQLHGIGPKLSARLEAAMLEHCRSTGVEMPQRVHSYDKNKRNIDGDDGDDAAAGPPTKKRKVREYNPQYRSGAYAILVAMSAPSAYPNMVKADIVRLATPHCDSSFDMAGDAQRHYTAWNSINTLVDKELVTKYGSPAKFTLTDAGVAIGKRLWDAIRQREKQTQTDVVDLAGSEGDGGDEPVEVVPESERPQTRDLTAPDSAIELQRIPAGAFTVHLVLDNREVKTQRDRDFIEQRLDHCGIALDARMLDVGDAVWVARCSDGTEIVLDYIVERKRLDDLVGSIKDGRFKEQKYRLSRCGCRNVIYIVEEYALSSDFFNDAIRTSLAGAQVNDGCFVKRVKNLQATVDYLIAVTKKLQRRYAERDLYVVPERYVDSRSFSDRLASLSALHVGKELRITYGSFAGISKKRGVQSAAQVWSKQLLCIRGLSVDKALEVCKHYPLPMALLKAYRDLPDDAAREALLSDKCTAFGRKAIGKALSKKVYALLHDQAD